MAAKQRTGLPFAFTEIGVLVLTTGFGIDKTHSVTMQIMRIYREMRETPCTHDEILSRLRQLEEKAATYDEAIQVMGVHLMKLLLAAQKSRRPFGFPRSDDRN